MTHSIEVLSGVRLDDVVKRMLKADERVRRAAFSITSRYFKHDNCDPPTIPNDCDPPELPNMPPVPQAVLSVVSNPTSSINHWSQEGRRDKEYSVIYRDCVFIDKPKLHGTPTQLVQAIKAIDEYADLYDEAANKYIEEVTKRVADYYSSQWEAVNELVALVK